MEKNWKKASEKLTSDKKRIVKVTWNSSLQISKGDEVEIIRGIVYNESNITASRMKNVTTGREEKSNIEGILGTVNPKDINPPIKGIVQEIKARSGETVFDLVVGVGLIEMGLGKLLKEASKFLDNEIVERCIRKKDAEDILTSAFRILEERIRAKIGAKPECFSIDLVKEAFNPQTGKLVFGDTEAERQGLLLIFMSSFMLFRNPSAHRFIQEYSEFEIFEMVCLVNLLLNILEKSKVRTEQPRERKKSIKKRSQKSELQTRSLGYRDRVVEEVYGVLIGGVKSIILSLKNSGYTSIGFSEWREMQDDHRYYMVDEEFSNRLDKFQNRLEKFSSTIWEIRKDILPKIILENVEEILEIRTNKVPHTIVNYIKGQQSIQSSPDLIDCFISETHPTDNAIQNQKGVSVSSYSLEITPIGEPTIKHDDLGNLNQFWESTLGKLQQNTSYSFIKKEKNKLLEEAKNLKEEIANRIKEQLRS